MAGQVPLPGMPGPAPRFVEQELAEWQELAGCWPLTFNLGDPYLRCGPCGQAVMRLEDAGGRGYVYAPGEASASVVAHLRQAHPNRG